MGCARQSSEWNGKRNKFELNVAVDWRWLASQAFGLAPGTPQSKQNQSDKSK